jgi:site-specific recombinase XerC
VNKNAQALNEQLPHKNNPVIPSRTYDVVAQQGGMAQGWNCHTVKWPMLRASYATHLFKSGSDLSAVLGTGRHSNRSGVLGHCYIRSTILYIHVLFRDPASVHSPLDGM